MPIFDIPSTMIISIAAPIGLFGIMFIVLWIAAYWKGPNAVESLIKQCNMQLMWYAHNLVLSTVWFLLCGHAINSDTSFADVFHHMDVPTTVWSLDFIALVVTFFIWTILMYSESRSHKWILNLWAPVMLFIFCMSMSITYSYQTSSTNLSKIWFDGFYPTPGATFYGDVIVWTISICYVLCFYTCIFSDMSIYAVICVALINNLSVASALTCALFCHFYV